MSKKPVSIPSLVYSFFIEGAGQYIPRLETPYQYARRLRNIEMDQYYRALRAMRKRGTIKVITKDGEKFIELTETGALEMLLQKARVQVPSKFWDGKWRVIVFDIPEAAHLERDRLRKLLQKFGFYKLQASVFIYPYPLNREAVTYLRQKGLMKYIRILKVEEMDNDTDLKKIFEL